MVISAVFWGTAWYGGSTQSNQRRKIGFVITANVPRELSCAIFIGRDLYLTLSLAAFDVRVGKSCSMAISMTERELAARWRYVHITSSVCLVMSVLLWNVDRRVETAERRQAVSWPCVTGQCDDARLPRPAYAVSRRACRLDAAVTSHVVRHLDVRWSRRRRRLTTGTRRYAAAPYAHRTRIDTY